MQYMFATIYLYMMLHVCNSFYASLSTGTNTNAVITTTTYATAPAIKGSDKENTLKGDSHITEKMRMIPGVREE
jgi:phospholipase C